VDHSFRTFFDLSLDLLCIANTDGYFEALNPAWTRKLGWALEDLKSRPFVDYVHPDDVEATLAEVVKLSQEGYETVSFENRYRTADGQWRWLSWTCGPDQVTGKLYAIARDVTDKKHLLSALVEAREAAEEANSAKSQFLANMSHELRTPLNAIIGYSEMLIEEAEERELQSCVDDLARVRSAGHHLLTLINQVLDLAKVEAGRIELFYEDVDVRSLCAEVLETLEPLAEQRGNRLRLDVEDVGTIVSDAVRLRQILVNVLSNAVKFSEDGEVSLHARRVPASPVDVVMIVVEDAGIGMTAEQLARVFEPFVQADPSTTRRFGGTGLGMAIAHHLAQLLDGSIIINSTPGEGTRVELRIPSGGRAHA